MAYAMTWLEEQTATIKGIEVCRENAINGPLLMHILASENRQQILEEEFGVTRPLQRELIIYNMKTLCENSHFTGGIEAEKCEGGAIFSNKRALLVREESIKIRSL